MKTKIYIVFIFILFALTLSPQKGRAGACDPPSEIGGTRKIDGPANVRERPDDETAIIASLANGTPVKIINYVERVKNGKTLLWYYVEWTDKGKKMEGWTHESNIVCD